MGSSLRAIECDKSTGETPTGGLPCSICGSAVSLLAPGKTVPRLAQVRVIELLSNAPIGLLWLAEKGCNPQQLFIAEYEPKGGGNACLRGLRSCFQRLQTLPAGLMPVLCAPTILEEGLILALEAPAWQSVKRFGEELSAQHHEM